MNWNLVFLLGALQGITLALVLFVRSKNQKPNRWLGWLILVLSIQFALIALSESLVFDYPDLRVFNWTLPYLFAPLTYLYIRGLLTGVSFDSRAFWHFVLFAVSLLVLFPYFNLTLEEKQIFTIDSTLYFFRFALTFEALRIVQIALYTFLSLRLINRFGTEAKRAISNLDMNWVRNFLYVSVCSWLIATLSIFIYFLDINLSFNPFNLVYLLALIWIYVLGYRLLSNPIDFGFVLEKSSQQDSTDKYSKSGFDQSKQDVLVSKLNALMRKDRLFLEADLTIQDVADRMGIPRHHLSQLINERLGQNFFDLVNSHRMDHVKSMLENPEYDHLKILAIAFDSGFKSKSAFNDLFKKHTGTTPSKYRSNFR